MIDYLGISPVHLKVLMVYVGSLLVQIHTSTWESANINQGDGETSGFVRKIAGVRVIIETS